MNTNKGHQLLLIVTDLNKILFNDGHFEQAQGHQFCCVVKIMRCLNYREFDLEIDLAGVPHACYLSRK